MVIIYRIRCYIKVHTASVECVRGISAVRTIQGHDDILTQQEHRDGDAGCNEDIFHRNADGQRQSIFGEVNAKDFLR